ncbi:MAG: hypothetical protein LBN34_04225 [Clostridiales Family XIII bacterium]|jgi:hypothetical protein|nr:hypothetical protein [Clostridiales Family XIII bacterium]
MEAINSISKPKISKDYAYVLQSSKLDELLKNKNFIIHTDLHYQTSQELGNIFEVFFWFPNKNCPYNRLYVRAGALLKNEVKSARFELYNSVFPMFEVWLRNILELPDNSPKLFGKPRFWADYKNGFVKISTSS